MPEPCSFGCWVSSSRQSYAGGKASAMSPLRCQGRVASCSPAVTSLSCSATPDLRSWGWKPRLGNWTRPFERQGARRTESDTTPSLVGGGQVHRHAYGCRENPTHVSQVPMTVASVLTTARVRLTASRSPAVEGGGAAPEGGAGRGTLPRRHVTRSRAKGFSLLVPHRHTASRLTLR